MTISLASLFSTETYASLLQKGLDVAESVGLPVTSWRAGDPTRSQYQYLAEVLSTLEPAAQAIVASGFLDFATGDALTVVARQQYGVERTEATFASGTLVLENTGGGLFTIAAGDVTFKSSVTGKTYRNTSGGTLASGPGTTLSLSWTADEAGTLSSVAVDEIDQLVTTLLAVEVQSSAAGAGLDEESDASLRGRCQDSLGALSPNGPADAYAFVARNPDLTGVTGVTRVHVIEQSVEEGPTGQVTVYLAGPSGAVSGAIANAVSDAIAAWATPLGITPTVLSATGFAYSVNATVYVQPSLGKTTSQVQEEAESAFEALLAEVPIGGFNGSLDRSLTGSRILTATGAYRIDFATPGDLQENVSEFGVLIPGSFNASVVFT